MAPLEGLVRVARRRGETARALDLLRRATRIRAAAYGDGHPTVAANRAELRQLGRAVEEP